MERFGAFLERNGFDAKEYQREGVEWMLNLETEGAQLGTTRIKGGILADEMGLGKTVQMLGLTLANFKMHTLIVLPRALLEQWEVVVCKTLGHRPLVYHGYEGRTCTLETLSRSPIVLTTYGMLAKLTEKPRKGTPLKFGDLHKISWDRVIFDEAHHMRNRNTRNHKAGVAVPGTHKWLVTGTPIQNSVKDFYGLCAVLGMEQGFYTDRDNIRPISDALILKRTKEGVGIVLPEMRRHIENVEWESPEEKMLAEDIHAHLQFAQVAMREDNPFMRSNFHHFAMLQRARQACIDMGLLEKSVQTMIELGIIEDGDRFLQGALKYQSKVNAVVGKIEERKDNGRPKLVFCHYHAEIDKVSSRLAAMGMKTARFDGRTSQLERDEILTSEDTDALVLQIRTGCEGLNLQRFSEVYFITPNWNPAVEDQAVARCHRIGQESEIDVFSFKMDSFDDEHFTKTLDLYVRELQDFKRREAAILDAEPEEDAVRDAARADEEPAVEPGKELDEKCAICLSPQHENTCRHMECGHYFHKGCIGKWLERGEGCPVCRHGA